MQGQPNRGSEAKYDSYKRGSVLSHHQPQAGKREHKAGESNPALYHRYDRLRKTTLITLPFEITDTGIAANVILSSFFCYPFGRVSQRSKRCVRDAPVLGLSVYL